MGAHGRHRPPPRRGRLRRPGPRARACAAPRRRCGCSPSRPRPRSARASSPTSAGPRCSTTSSSPPPTSPASPRRRARSSTPGAGGSPSTRPTSSAAAAALAERAQTTQLTGADMLRLALGLDGSTLAGGITVGGGGWASELLTAAAEVSGEPATEPDGFVGELRTYQADALAWLGFLESAGIGGCLALDMGLGKTPTMLAHLVDTTDRGPALGHRPAGRRRQLGVGSAPVRPRPAGRRCTTAPTAPRPTRSRPRSRTPTCVLTTYGTAVRDIDAIEKVQWATVVLDEAQAIKNPASDTAQQLRRIPARVRVALTGTPIENGLGDLWAILDFTNPGLVGPRPQFVASLSGDGDSSKQSAENALRGAQRHPRVPPHQGRARDRRRAARPHRRARPLLDDARADRPLPGRARQARPRERPARRRGAPQGPDPRRDHRAQADLQPPGGVPGRRQAAGGPVGQARAASRRSSTSSTRRANGC